MEKRIVELREALAAIAEKCAKLKTRAAREKQWEKRRLIWRELRLLIDELYTGKTLRVSGRWSTIIGDEWGCVNNFCCRYYDGSAFTTAPNEQGHNIIKLDLSEMRVEVVADETPLDRYPAPMVRNNLFPTLNR